MAATPDPGDGMAGDVDEPVADIPKMTSHLNHASRYLSACHTKHRSTMGCQKARGLYEKGSPDFEVEIRASQIGGVLDYWSLPTVSSVETGLR
jgi:hypothetical protein